MQLHRANFAGSELTTSELARFGTARVPNVMLRGIPSFGCARPKRRLTLHSNDLAFDARGLLRNVTVDCYVSCLEHAKRQS